MELGVWVSLAALLISGLGFLLKRDGSKSSEAEWRGAFSSKLDSILASVTGVRADVDKLENRVNEYGERIATVEASTKQVHKRLDELRK